MLVRQAAIKVTERGDIFVFQNVKKLMVMDYQDHKLYQTIIWTSAKFFRTDISGILFESNYSNFH